jgi:gluconolactonase
VYFTDPLMRAATEGTNVKPMGNVYYIRPDGRLLLIDKEIARPNGITLSLDEKTLYVNDGLGVDVFAFDVQPDGSAGNKRSFVKLREPITDAQGTRSRADGMAVDSAGRLYVATGSGIQVINPRGEYLGIIRVPSIMNSIAFAGPNRQTLYLTGRDSLYRIQMIASGPAGRAK